MTPPSPAPAPVVSSEKGRTPSEQESRFASLALLTALEASLQSGQRALLDLDPILLTTCTEEQIRLVAALHNTLWSAGNKSEASVSAQDFPLEPQPALASLADLQTRARRLLHLARVHSSLLGRARLSLTVLSNFLADSAASYGPFTSTTWSSFTPGHLEIR